MKKLIILLFVTFCFFGCEKEDLSVTSIAFDSKSIILDYDETREIYVTTLPIEAPLVEYTVRSNNDDIVTVDTIGVIKIKGVKVGEGTVSVLSIDRTLTDTCYITVNATNFLFEEPVVAFGSNKSDIKVKESRILLSETENILIYGDENTSVRGVIYYFENGNLFGSVVLLKEDKYTADQSVDFLKQRYDFLGVSDDIASFGNDTILIGLTNDETLGFSTTYIANSSAGGRLSGDYLTENILKIANIYNDVIDN